MKTSFVPSLIQGSTPREHIVNVMTKTDRFEVSQNGDLLFAGRGAEELLLQFGSPLYVISEDIIRDNFRRIKKAFQEHWPQRVTIMYAIKANNNPAVRAVIHQEGGGGDCFGLGELYATFEGGADPGLIAMNGSNKTPVELRAAIERGVNVNIDAVEEVHTLNDICGQMGKTGSVALRIKCAPESLEESSSDYLGCPTDVRNFLVREKWGFSCESAVPLVQEILKCKHLHLRGFSLHTPRFTQDPNLFAECTSDFADIVVQIRDATGYCPELIDIGGGWPRDRDPESRRYSLNPSSVEKFAEYATNSMLRVFEESHVPVPELRLEPGRFIIGNASILLGRVGNIKRDCGHIWANVDFSTNNLPRIDTASSAYHVLPATGMDRQYDERVQIVGSTCIDSRIADDWQVPRLSAGEPIVVLDAGMYSESASTQFNSVPRPATVMIGGDSVHVIRRRESVEDVYSHTSIPHHLVNNSTSRPADAIYV